jgi:hypothetical protein
MRCPKCQFDHELQTTECLKCGIVFARYPAALEAGSKTTGPIEASPVPSGAIESSPNDPGRNDVARLAAVPIPLSPIESNLIDLDQKYDARKELKYRAFALPLALLVARLVVGTGLRVAVRMLTMVLHESGHALTSLLTGRWALPMLWVTMHGEERSLLVVLAVTAAIGFAGYKAWVAQRWAWVIAAGAVLMVQLLCLTVWRYYAECFIIFFGDGGALVLATILMAMFYIDHESALYKNWGMRWAFLAIGALTFMDVYLTWTGPLEDIPFGEMEGVNLSDPSLLMEMYGWSVLLLVDRYIRLARICLMALAVIYLWGLVSVYRQMQSPASSADEQ